MICLIGKRERHIGRILEEIEEELSDSCVCFSGSATAFVNMFTEVICQYCYFSTTCMVLDLHALADGDDEVDQLSGLMDLIPNVPILILSESNERTQQTIDEAVERIESCSRLINVHGSYGINLTRIIAHLKSFEEATS